MEIDSREPFKIKVHALKTGDISFECPLGKVIMERKTPEDFLASLQDKDPNGANRLERELLALKEKADIPILLIEGKFTLANIRGFKMLAIRNMLFAIKLNGIIVEFCDDAIKRATELYSYLNKKKHYFLRKGVLTKKE